MSPVRIQRKRTKGWRLPANTICAGRPGILGNPFRTAGEYRRWLIGGMSPREFADKADGRYSFTEYREVLRRLVGLRGVNLACWCALTAECHVDVQLEIANREDTRR